MSNSQMSNALTCRKRIGIISLGYGWLPGEPGPSRFYYVAQLFAEAGWDVDFVMSSFQHFEKKQKDEAKLRQGDYPFKLTFIHQPSYKLNIGLGRILSNRVAARNLKKYLETVDYDLIYCSMPDNQVAMVAAKAAEAKGIPFIADVEDLWPEALSMVIRWDPLKKLIFPYFERPAEECYKRASAVIGTSEDYTQRAVKNGSARADVKLETVYVGCDLDAFDQGVKEHLDTISKAESEWWLTYTGNLGKSYHLETLLEAAELLKDDENLKIKILGTGVMEEKLQAMKAEKGLDNVEFLGYQPYPYMAAYLVKSDAALNSFRKNAPQSIVNKVGDYLASGHPMINTLENPVFCELVNFYECGLNVPAEDAKALAEAVLGLKNHPEESERMGRNARKLAEEEFDRPRAYARILEIAEELTAAKA